MAKKSVPERADKTSTRSKAQPDGPLGAGPLYQCSPEHKTHPGSWGSGQWHPRSPTLSACPTDIKSDALPQTWLNDALRYPCCWNADPDAPPDGLPRYAFWFVADRGTFFCARLTRLPGLSGQQAQYKGYPAGDEDVPKAVADAMLVANLISTSIAERLRRARRKAMVRR